MSDHSLGALPLRALTIEFTIAILGEFGSTHSRLKALVNKLFYLLLPQPLQWRTANKQ